MIGAPPEMAFAKWIGVKWHPKVLRDQLIDQDDVSDIEIRSTILPCRCGNEQGCLRVNRKGTKPDSLYILVIRRGRRFEIAGFMLGRDCMEEKYWGKHYYRDKPGWSEYCYGVPRQDIDQDINLLRAFFR